jgi:hypothetical protein
MTTHKTSSKIKAEVIGLVSMYKLKALSAGGFETLFCSIVYITGYIKLCHFLSIFK